jgi:NADH/NAD ratio-sensing transcriptional regulator Rex
MWDYADVYKKSQFAYSYVTLHEWIYKKQKGKTFEKFLKDKGIYNIALYSYGTLGSIFLPEFLKSNIKVSYIIDKNSQRLPEFINEIPVVNINEINEYKNSDAIVVCHVYYYNSIVDDLTRLGINEDKIISLNDIVFSI